jgi:hypothetical protein
MRLGHIGDQVFGLAVTNLIQDLYPHLRVGPASVRQYSTIHLESSLTLRIYRK